jgi:gamma-glutamylcyclotransferase (GGCT)/AIG2-like uncharacterized protein YtfP
VQKDDFLFVYGTLRRSQGADLSKNLNTRFIGEDVINGELYNLGSYPGLKKGTTSGLFYPSLPLVVGDVFMLLGDGVVSILDAYEGYPSLYDRIEVFTASGRKVWVYIYPHSVPDNRRIECGDWIHRTEDVIDDITQLAMKLQG